MANRYWVGGTGTWNTTSTTNWSTASGGASGASVPTAADSVFFDQAGTYTVTMTGALTCLDITVSAGTVTFATGTTPTLAISGSMTLLAGTVWNSTGAITFNSTAAGNTITTNGVSISANITFNGSGGTWTLGSAITSSGANGFFFTAGTFSTSASNYAITSPQIITNGGTVNLNGSTLTLSGVVPLNFSSGTFNSGTSQINISNNTVTINGSVTYYNVTFTNLLINKITISGANTFNNFTMANRTGTGGCSYISLGGNQTINGTFQLSVGPSPEYRTFVFADIFLSTRTITAATVGTLYGVDFQDITGAGTGVWSGTSIGDCLGNSGITFSTPKTVYWNLAGSVNWAATGWALTSGGTPSAANFPLAQDTAIFDNTGAAGTISITAPFNLPTMDLSARTSAMTLVNNTSNAVVYGNWKSGTGVSYSGNVGVVFSGRSGQTITSNGVPFFNYLWLNTISTASLILQDSLTLFLFNLIGGKLDLNNKTMTLSGALSSNFSSTRSILFGTSGYIAISGFNGGIFNLSTSTGFSTTGTIYVGLTYTGSTGTRTVQNAFTESQAAGWTVKTTGTSGFVVTTPALDSINLSGSFDTIDLTGLTNTIVFYSTIYNGNLTIPSNIGATSGSIFVAGTSATTRTIDGNGKSIGQIIVNTDVPSTATIKLLSNITCTLSSSAYFQNKGNLDLNGKTLTTSTFNYQQTAGTVTFNSGTIICTGSTVYFLSGITALAGTGNGLIQLTSSSSKTFSGNNNNFPITLDQAGAGNLNIDGTNTFANITNSYSSTGATSITFFSSQTFANWQATGSAGKVLTVKSLFVGTPMTLTKTGGGYISGVDYINYSDIYGSPSSDTWYFGSNSNYSTTNSTNVTRYVYNTTRAANAILVLSGSSWTVPADWNNTINTIHLIGGGGGGAGAYASGSNAAAGGGGGGGGYTKLTNQTLSGVISYSIGSGGTGGGGGTNGGNGGTTSWNSGAATAGGGGGGKVSTTPSSTGGTAGVGSTFNGGAGAAGAFGTVAATGYGGGGGGGAAGPQGMGGAGGTGFGSTTAANISGGGGGGNGGGTAGANGASAVGGSGGNNYLGQGGGTASITPSLGGGGNGGVSTSSGYFGTVGNEIFSGFGSGGGSSGAAAAVGYFGYNGGGGGGGGVSTAGVTYSGGQGGGGVIVVVYTPASIYSTNISETTTATDSTVGYISFPTDISETSAITDLTSSQAIFATSVSEISTATDLLSSQALFVSNLGETSSITDSTVGYITFPSSISESSLISDQTFSQVTFVSSLNETTTGTDSLSATPIFNVNFSDTTSATDLAVSYFSAQSSVDEATTATDALGASAVFPSALSEVASSTDVFVGLPSFNSSLLEVASATENFTTSAIFQSAILESTIGSDSFIGAYLWNQIDDSQTPNWQNVDDSQTPTWTEINNTQTMAWTEVTNTQTPGWSDVNDSQSPGWQEVNQFP